MPVFSISIDASGAVRGSNEAKAAFSDYVKTAQQAETATKSVDSQMGNLKGVRQAASDMDLLAQKTADSSAALKKAMQDNVFAVDSFYKNIEQDFAKIEASQMDMVRTTNAVNEAFKALGMRSMASVTSEIKSLGQAYEALKNSGTVSVGELSAAKDKLTSKVRSLTQEYASMTAGGQGASKEIQAMASSTTATASTMGQAGMSAESFGNMLVGLGVKVGAATVAYRALKAVVQEVADFMGRGLDFNAELESARIGIGSIIAATMDVKNAQGGMVTGMEKFSGAQTVARDLMKQIQISGLETTAQTKDLVAGFQALLGPASAAGFTLGQTKDFVLTMVQSMGALGIEANQLSSEGRSLLDGSINPMQDRLATALGITGEMVSQWKEQNTLFAELQKRMEAFKFAGSELANSWSGLKSNVQDAISYLAGESTQGLFDGIKKSWQELLAALVDTKNFQPGAMVSNLVAGFKEINNDLGSGIVSATKSFVSWLGQANEYVGQHKESFAAIWEELKGIGNGFLTILESAGDLLQFLLKWITEGQTFYGYLAQMNRVMALVAQGADFLVLGIKTAAAGVANYLLPPLAKVMEYLGKAAQFAGFDGIAKEIQQVSQGLSGLGESTWNSLTEHAQKYKDSLFPVFDAIMAAAKQTADEEKKSQGEITGSYEAEASKRRQVQTDFDTAYKDYIKGDTKYQLQELDKQFSDYRKFADDKLKVDELYNAKKADILSKDPAFSAYEKLYQSTGAQEYYNKLIDMENQLLDVQQSADEKATGSWIDSLKLRDIKMQEFIDRITGKAQQAANSINESLNSATSNDQGDVNYTSFSGWDHALHQVIQTPVISSPVTYVFNGQSYSSEADMQTAIDAANTASEAAASAAQEAAQAASEAATQAAQEAQQAAEQQQQQWQSVLSSYQSLADSLSDKKVSFDPSILRGSFTAALDSVDSAKAFLTQLQDQANDLKTLQSGWTSLSTNIASEIQSIQREGWGLSDYVDEFNRLGDQLQTMALGSNDALEVAQDQFDVLKQIRSLQSQQLQSQQQLTTGMLGIMGTADSAIGSLTASSLSPAQSSAAYNSQYTDLFTRAKNAIASNSDEASTLVSSFIQYAQGSYLQYMQANNQAGYQSIFNSVIGDIQALKDAAGNQIVSSGVLGNLTNFKQVIQDVGKGAQGSAVFVDWLNQRLATGGGALTDASATAANSANYLSATLGQTAGYTANSMAAFQALQDYTNRSATAIADSMTQLIKGINDAVTALSNHTSTDISTTSTTTEQKPRHEQSNWQFVQTGSEVKQEMFNGKLTDITYKIGYYTIPGYEQYVDPTYKPLTQTKVPSYAYSPNVQPWLPDFPAVWYSATGNIFSGSAPALTWIAERGVPEAAVPLDAPGIEKFTTGLGFGQASMKVALKEALKETLSDDLELIAGAIIAAAKNTGDLAKLAKKADVIGTPPVRAN